MGVLRTYAKAWPARVLASVLFVFGVGALVYASDGRRYGRDAHPTPPARPDASQRLLTRDGTSIVVASGRWSAADISAKLTANGVNSLIAPMLTVRVSDAYPPTRVVSRVERRGPVGFRATLWLDAWPGSTFSASPDWTIGHEVGHVWARYYLATTPDGWQRYLLARGLAGDPRIETSYVWRREEIFAEDYRLLFGSDAAIAAGRSHLNSAIPDPRTVAGLEEFLRTIVTPS